MMRRFCTWVTGYAFALSLAGVALAAAASSGAAQNHVTPIEPGQGGAVPMTPPARPINPPHKSNSTSGNTEATQDQATMDQAEKKIKATFEDSPDWKAAQGAFHKASTDFSTARAAAVAKLKATPDYIDASQKSEKSYADLDTLRKNPSSSSNDLAAGASAALAAKSSMSAMEKKAFATDPAVVEARKNLDTASAAMAKLREQEHTAVLADVDYLAAKQKLDTARGTKTPNG